MRGGSTGRRNQMDRSPPRFRLSAATEPRNTLALPSAAPMRLAPDSPPEPRLQSRKAVAHDRLRRSFTAVDGH